MTGRHDLSWGFVRAGWSRRDVLRRALIAGLSVPAIAATPNAGAAPAVNGRRLSAALLRAQPDQGTLVIADNMTGGGLWLTFDPGHFYENNPQAALCLVYETLYDVPDFQQPNRFEPLLASVMPEVAADGSEAIIRLREGVRFHQTDNEMTAADWVFSFNRTKNLKDVGAFLVTDYWESVEAVDPMTLRFVRPSPVLVPVLSATLLTVLDSAAVRERGATDAEDADQTDSAQQYLNENSHGTGPFVMRGWSPETEVVIERNPSYWGEAPRLDRIIWTNIPSASGQLQAVQTGDADLAYVVEPDAAQQVRDDPNLQLFTTPMLGIEYLAMNTGQEVGGPLADKNVRRAISLAIDYDGIIDGVLAGAGQRVASVVPLPLGGSEAVLGSAYQTDLAAAQEAFDAAGLGEVEATLSYGVGAGEQALGGANLETLVTKIQADLQQIKGLTVALNPMDPAARLTAFREGKLQMTIGPWGIDYPDAQAWIEPMARSDGSVPERIAYANPRIDALLDRAKVEPDANERGRLYADVQRLLLEDVPYVVLFQPIDQKPARRSVEGVAAHPLYQIQLRHASKNE